MPDSLFYLRSVRNASPHTLRNYELDLSQFLSYLTPGGGKPPAVRSVDHLLIREYLGFLHDQQLQVVFPIARKLAALRSLFKFCSREGLIADNPARLVATPKLPKRLPVVLSAEEMNGFLDMMASGPIPVSAESGQSVSATGASGRRQIGSLPRPETAPSWNSYTPRDCGSAN